MSKFLLSVLVAFTLVANVALADGVKSLKDFYKETRSMRAQFNQKVKDSTGATLQQVEGTMQLQRPNKFRWDYKKPYEQEIISDGKDVFLYDIDLEQVTIRSLSQTLGTSPAALLAGGANVEKNFSLTNRDRQDNLDWVEAVPKGENSGYERVFLGFNGTTLAKMELYDSFKNITQIAFESVERNPTLKDKTFLFSVPDGIDVVGE